VTTADVFDAVASVDDPEFPGVSIVSLGMLHEITESPDRVRVELIPTYSGCPALEFIGAHVRAAVQEAAPGRAVDVVWRRDLLWSTDRLSPATAPTLAAEFSVIVRGSDGSLRCPVCGWGDVTEKSPVGPTRCRAVAWCASCRNVLEVMR
jgi:ring-1,2-phenylacetyl-CoA epoxidase subunit PaaD